MEGCNNNLAPGRRPVHHWVRWLWLLCALPLSVAAAPAEIRVLLSSDAGFYQQVLSAFGEQINRRHPDAQIHTTILNKDQPADFSGAEQLLVAVGANACKRAIADRDPRPLLCTFLPRNTYWSLLKRHPPQPASRLVSAVFFDQSIERYLALIEVLIPTASQLGTSVGPKSKVLLPEIKQLAKARGLTVNVAQISDDQNPVATLTPVVEASDVFLVNADRPSLNKAISKWLLLLSIRQRMPVIAYSQSYVNAGALAAIFTTPADSGRDSGELVARWLQNPAQPLPAPRHPRYFSLATNPNVARSLRISLQPNAELHRQVLQKLAQPRVDTGTQP